MKAAVINQSMSLWPGHGESQATGVQRGRDQYFRAFPHHLSQPHHFDSEKKKTAQGRRVN